MATTPKGSDRRVQRTRQMIRQAFIELVAEKGLTAVSIQDVTRRANISRGTFYAHYADKYELAEAIMREEFQSAIGSVSLASGWNRTTLRSLIATTLIFFKTIYRHHHRTRDISPLLEHTILEELNKVLLSLLKQNHIRMESSSLTLEAISQIMSWTIFGAAIQWSHNSTVFTADEMAQAITQLVIDGVGNLLPET